MTRTFACAAVLFDLDGVLADSTHAVERSWEAWSQPLGIDPRLAVVTGHGRTTIEAVRELAPDADPQASLREMEALEESFIDSVVPVKGAPGFVARVDELQIPWAVVTSGTRRIAVPRLRRCGIPEPRVLITADDITRGKPDPQPYEKAAAALSALPGRCVVFEDSPNGILSARRAGARVIAITRNAVPPAEVSQADAVVADFSNVAVASKHDGCGATDFVIQSC